MKRFGPICLAAMVVAGLISVGCRTPGLRPALPPLPAGGNPAGWNEADVSAARRLFVNKCSSCHKFHDPARYRSEEWNTWMTKMSRKARLSPQQEETLRQFLDAYRRVD